MSVRRESNNSNASTTHEETETMSTRRTAKRIATALLGTVAALAATAAMAAPASAAPALDMAVKPDPKTGVTAGGLIKYSVSISNTGDAPTQASVPGANPEDPPIKTPLIIEFEAPEGLKIVKFGDPGGARFEEILEQFGISISVPVWKCTTAPDGRSAECKGLDPDDAIGPLLGAPGLPIGPGESACEFTKLALGEEILCPLEVYLEGDPGLEREGTVTPTAEVSGGTSPTGASASMPTTTWRHFDLTYFEAGNFDDVGNPYTRAGGRPDTNVTDFEYAGSLEEFGKGGTSGHPKNLKVVPPAGTVVNPTAYEQCTEAQLVTESCPPDSQIGTVTLTAFDYSTGTATLNNMVPAPGQPAQFGFNVSSVAWIHIHPVIRPDGTFSVDADGISQLTSLYANKITFWGVPADPAHDDERVCPGQEGGCPSTAPLKPYFTLPTSCTGPQTTTIEVDFWQDPGKYISLDSVAPGNDECNALDFSPSIEARPTTNVADSPSGLDVDVHVPQHENCDPGPPVSCEVATAHLKDTVIELPEGISINPSGANGLGACSPAQIGIDAGTGTPNGSKPTCPNSSRIGSVEVETPLVAHTLPGSVYLATPYENPFDSLIAIYIVVNDPQSGILQKLSGEVVLDPVTGKLTTSVENAPQLPFEHFKVHIFGGARGALRTPEACGEFTVGSTLTPWSAPDSGPPATPSDSWAIAQAPNGGTCPASSAARPNTPTLDAGMTSPIAGSYNPLVVDLRRPDGSQQLSTVSLTMPPGLTGKLAGIAQCSEAALASAAGKSGQSELASASCPADSRIATVDVAAGAGPAPYWTKGTAYLTPPYKGAPLGMAIITPATAGPYDLGTVVVRAALRVDSRSGQITAETDPIPSILAGIPLDVRAAIVRADREGFTRTGTNCNPFAFSGTLVSTLGQPASLSSRYQLGECARLSFKPKLGIRLFGATKRGGHPRLLGTVAMPEGANIAGASVALPKSEFLDQGNIRTVCTRVQFAADQCPAASVYGKATAMSPLVDYPLAGPVYLRSSDNELPDLVAALRGPAHQPIEVEVVGRIDSVKGGGIRTTFEGVPDLPVSRFTLDMQGGKRKGLLENSTDICRKTNRATAEFTGQNGKTLEARPALRNAKCAKKKRKAAKQRRGSRRAAR